MCGRVRITGWFAAVVCLMSVQTRACHVVIHYTKAEIEAANIRLYERDVSERDRDITGFDQRHGLLGEVLGSQQFYEQELQAWKSHPGRFDLEHPGLGRVIDGEMLYDKKHPFEPSVLPLPPELLHPGGPGDPGGSEQKTPGQPGGGGSGFQFQTASVPEPASGVLGFTALIVGLVAMIGRTPVRRTEGCSAPSRQEPPLDRSPQNSIEGV
jgi:hypothetical protein